MLIIELFTSNKTESKHTIGNAYNHLYPRAVSINDLLKNNNKPNTNHDATLTKASESLNPTLNSPILSLITPKGRSKKKTEYLFKPLVNRKAKETTGTK